MTRLDCKWSFKALHGAKIVVKLVDSDLDDGCFDNILNVVDNTPKSKKSMFKHPGKSAKCGLNDFGARNKKWKVEGDIVTITFKSSKNNGHGTFKLEVTSTVVGRLKRFCPLPEAYGCPDGPCCTGPDCCKLEAGVETKGRSYKSV